MRRERDENAVSVRPRSSERRRLRREQEAYGEASAPVEAAVGVEPDEESAEEADESALPVEAAAGLLPEEEAPALAAAALAGEAALEPLDEADAAPFRLKLECKSISAIEH